VVEDDALAAGDFGTWLEGMQGALAGDRAADVPCAGCTACCRSSQFVHIGPDETDALAHIPPALLFPAPRMPKGHVVMGYDERGHCPMLVDDRCSIYEHRPRTCRTYDCRVFAAAGVAADKPPVRERAVRWRFTVASPTDRTAVEAVRAAAAYLERHAPDNPTQRAVLAVELHDLFLAGGEPDPDEVARRLRSC